MTKVFRVFSLLLAGLLFAGLLAACGDTPTNTTTSATTAAVATTAATSATTAATGATTAATSATTAAAGTTAAASATTAAPGATTAAAAAPTATPYPTVAQAPGSLKITFWYGLTGSLGGVVQQVVNKYNSSQTKYYVEAVQNSNYDDTINKLNTSLAGGNLPSVVQIYDIGTQRMIDTKKILPVQDLIDRDKLDLVKDLEPAVASYYTVGGKLYSMPFNSSAPVLYYDKAAFKEAGLDPEKPPRTYEELLEAARKLTKKDASGKITRSGIDFTLYGWILEQQMAIQTANYAEPGNGRSARATQLNFNNEAGQNWLNIMKKLQDEGVGRNLGRHSGTTNGTTMAANFTKGEAAMAIDSIAVLRGWQGQIQTAGSKVDLGVAYLPKPANAKGGVIIGGASLWITNQGSKEQQEGAWDFVKFTSTPELQAFWAANTGYYPIRKAAYDLPEMKDALTKYPQFKVAIDQLRSTEASSATQGAIFGTFAGARVLVEGAMEQYMTGKATSAKAALDDAAKKANENLSEYNATVK
jgi:sn-glycerol 3-phosphate transport system substrate-binding protein